MFTFQYNILGRYVHVHVCLCLCFLPPCFTFSTSHCYQPENEITFLVIERRRIEVSIFFVTVIQLWKSKHALKGFVIFHSRFLLCFMDMTQTECKQIVILAPVWGRDERFDPFKQLFKKETRGFIIGDYSFLDCRCVRTEKGKVSWQTFICLCAVMRWQTMISFHPHSIRLFGRVYKHFIYIWHEWLCHPD